MSTSKPLSDVSEKDKIRRKFRIVNTLLCICRSINIGHLTLPPENSNTAHRAPAVDKLLSSRQTPIEAVASVLVMEHEVLATVSFKAIKSFDERRVPSLVSGGIVMQDPVKNKADPGNSSDIPEVEELENAEWDQFIESDFSEGDHGTDHMMKKVKVKEDTKVLNIAISSNPLDDSPSPPDNPEAIWVLEGKNRWPDVMAQKWKDMVETYVLRLLIVHSILKIYH
jgi:hypothetical protein